VQESLSVVLAGPQDLQVRRVPVPRVPGPAVRVRMKACGICGSDLRYLAGENPWSLHTLGRHVPCPPGVILGHEVAGIVLENGRERRLGILAFKGCGQCLYCRTGRENLCAEVQHIGHASGWPEMPHYPSGMAEEFEVWKDFDYDLPDSISFEEAIFLDGLAVAVHAAGEARLEPGKRAGVIGLGYRTASRASGPGVGQGPVFPDRSGHLPGPDPGRRGPSGCSSSSRTASPWPRPGRPSK